MFSNIRSALSQCNTRIRLLHLLYDIEARKQVVSLDGPVRSESFRPDSESICPESEVVSPES